MPGGAEMCVAAGLIIEMNEFVFDDTRRGLVADVAAVELRIKLPSGLSESS